MPYKLYNASIANVKNDFKKADVEQLPWSEAVPTQFTQEACTLFDRLTKTIWDISCSLALPSICIMESDTTFKLVGLCGNSILDKNYIFKKFDTPTLYGDNTVSVWFEEAGSKWIAVDKKGTLLATAKAPKSSLLIGTHNWTIYNDSLNCQLRHEGNPYTLPLNLNACTKEEFNCMKGSCIDLDKRCDGVTNCYDRSDELQCSKILMESTYNKKIPPPVEDKVTRYTTVNINLDIIDIIEIDEVKGSFRIKLRVEADWFDNRVTFSNLRLDLRLNKLDDKEFRYIWKPDILFMNIISNEDREIFGTPKTYIKRSIAKPQKSSNDWALRKTISYGGKFNNIIFSETSRKDYLYASQGFNVLHFEKSDYIYNYFFLYYFKCCFYMQSTTITTKKLNHQWQLLYKWDFA